MALTTKQCQNAKSQEKPYKLADAGGLYLLINPNGSKYWRLKYRFLGKEKLMALGTFPTIALAEAREGRDKARKLLAADPPIDPMEKRVETRQTAIRNSQNSFQAVAMEWYENQKDRWSEGYAQKNTQSKNPTSLATFRMWAGSTTISLENSSDPGTLSGDELLPLGNAQKLSCYRSCE